MSGLVGCKVNYHAQDASGQLVQWYGNRQEFVAFADFTTNTFQHAQWNVDAIVAILNANGRGVPAGTSLIIDQLVSMDFAWAL